MVVDEADLLGGWQGATGQTGHDASGDDGVDGRGAMTRDGAGTESNCGQSGESKLSLPPRAKAARPLVDAWHTVSTLVGRGGVELGTGKWGAGVAATRDVGWFLSFGQENTSPPLDSGAVSVGCRGRVAWRP